MTDRLIPPPDSFENLSRLRKAVSDAWWRENDCVEGMKLASREARLFKECDSWLCWIMAIVEGSSK